MVGGPTANGAAFERTLGSLDARASGPTLGSVRWSLSVKQRWSTSQPAIRRPDAQALHVQLATYSSHRGQLAVARPTSRDEQKGGTVAPAS